MAVSMPEQNMQLRRFEQRVEELPEQRRLHFDFCPDRFVHFRQVDLLTECIQTSGNILHLGSTTNSGIPTQHKKPPSAVDHAILGQKQCPALSIFERSEPAADGINIEKDMFRCRSP